MQYVEVVNLEKYHPGYTDRSLIWCKAYFSILNAEPEFELLCEIDKWRFIAFIMLQLQIKKPVPLDRAYLERKGFDYKKRHISLTLQMLHSFIKVCGENNKNVTQSRVDKSRVDKKQASPALKAALDKINNEGINIYALIAKTKKLIGQPKDWQFPEEVLLKVCGAYDRDKVKIEKPWPWFTRVMKVESGLWHAAQEVKLNDKRSKWAFSLGDILKGAK